MPRLSFETDGEKKMYDRGRRDALQELFRDWYAELTEREAFPDKNPGAFTQWGIDVLLPQMNRYRGQDDLYQRLMDI
jgi:hypothetical protein